MLVGGHGPGRNAAARYRGVLFALSAALMMGACAQLGDAPIQSLAKANDPVASQPQSGSELDKAVAYWGEQYDKNPRDKTAAISYARNLKAAGQKEKALQVLQQVALFHNSDRELASEYGRLALEFNQVPLAQKLLAFADDPGKPDWRIVSARGTVLAKQGDYKGATEFYERALKLSPGQPSVVNNLAMAHAANGQADKAEPLLRTIAQDRNADAKVRQNLALVLGLQGKYGEATQMAQADLSHENAASDVDYMRQMVKLDPRREPRNAAPTTAVAQAPKAAPALRPAVADARRTDTGSWDARVAQAPSAPTLKPSQR